MTTQEEINTSMMHLLMMATDLLKEADKSNDNFKMAQSLIRQCFFKYLDLADCPFRDVCREQIESEYESEPEAPIDVRGELD